MSDVNLFSSSASEEILNNILTDAVMNHRTLTSLNPELISRTNK